MGEVLSDLVRRNGKVDNVKSQGLIKVIDGRIPLKSVFGYSTALRSLTQGRGNYIMETSYYEIVPEDEVNKIRGI